MSKDYFISDVHIQDSHDDAAELFVLFLKTSLQENADRVFLLGDIFDLMVGPYLEYEEKYKRIFEHLQELMDHGIDVYYFEGNHDFHLKKLFEKYKGKKGRIHYVKEGLYITTAQGQIAHVSHGDDMEIENTSYKIYKTIINNRFVELLTEQILSYNFVEKLGKKASADSKRRNSERYSKETQQEVVRNKFRKSAELWANKINVDVIIAGHSHFKDDYKTANGTRYLNNGYALQSQSFLYSDETGIRFKKL